MTERPIIWVGYSKKQLMNFPKEVMVQIGYALGEAQNGRKADYAKPLSGLEAGVLEIVADHNTDTYRAVYAVKLGRVDKLDSQISQDLIQGSFYGGCRGAFADGRRRVGVL